MLGLISFSFKVLIAAVVGGALNYSPHNGKNRVKIIITCLICIYSASIVALSVQIASVDDNFIIGCGMLCVVISTIFILNEKVFLDKIDCYFASVIGMIIGAGYIIQACILFFLVYFILQNSDKLIKYINNKNEEPDNSKAENITD